MAKKLLIQALAMVMLFGFFRLTACNLGSEETYTGSATDRAKMFTALDEIAGLDCYTL